MAKFSICLDPNCGGKLIADKRGIVCLCEKCRNVYDGNPEVQALLNEGQTSALTMPTLSPFSRQAPVAAEPVTLRDLVPVPEGYKKEENIMTVFAASEGLGGGLVKDMPYVEPVDRKAQINFDLRPPLLQRECGNRECVDTSVAPDAGGKRPRTKLYWEADPSEAPTKMPANSRLETVTDPETGVATTYFVLDAGFCRNCGTKYSYMPIKAGTIIDNEVRVDGPFAWGGESFLYHGWHLELNIPVVIKTPHDMRGTAGREAAETERETLTQLMGAPGIVRLIGYKTYEKQKLVVLEWLDGQTLKQIRETNGGPLLIEVGLSYAIAAAKAIRACQQLNPPRLSPDAKHSNFIVLAPGDKELKAIDFGGAYVMNRPGQGVVLTEGYHAPDWQKQTRARGILPGKEADTFAMFKLVCYLSLSHSPTKYAFELPKPTEEPLFAEFESLYRFGLRCMSYNAPDRMSIEEFIEQATALRAQIVALKEKRSVPTVSYIFAPDVSKALQLDYSKLPSLLVDRTDAAAHLVEAALATPDPKAQREMLEKVIVDFPASKEAKLRLAGLALDTGDRVLARSVLEQFKLRYPYDCRVLYLLGRLALSDKNNKEAERCFDACFSHWPTEVPVILVKAYMAELRGDWAAASRYYETASRVNAGYVAGPFGWARSALKGGFKAIAVEAYDLVPMQSWAYGEAVLAKVGVLTDIVSGAGKGAKGVGLPELQDAANSVEFLVGQGETPLTARLQADLFGTAVTALGNKSLAEDPQVTLLGVPLIKSAMKEAEREAVAKCAVNESASGSVIERVVQRAEAIRTGRWRLF